MKNHEFSYHFHDFPMILGKSRWESHPPPQDVCTPNRKQWYSVTFTGVLKRLASARVVFAVSTMAHNQKRQGQTTTPASHQKTRNPTPTPFFQTSSSVGSCPPSRSPDALQDVVEVLVRQVHARAAPRGGLSKE